MPFCSLFGDLPSPQSAVSQGPVFPSASVLFLLGLPDLGGSGAWSNKRLRFGPCDALLPTFQGPFSILQSPNQDHPLASR